MVPYLKTILWLEFLELQFLKLQILECIKDKYLLFFVDISWITILQYRCDIFITRNFKFAKSNVLFINIFTKKYKKFLVLRPWNTEWLVFTYYKKDDTDF